MPDLKPQVYTDPRPAERFMRFHEHIRANEPGWTYEAVRMVLTPLALGFYRARAIGTERVPARGAVILAPNHFSNMDHFFLGVYIRRKIHFMAKSQLFGQNPLFDYIFRLGGVFPVRRGHGDPEPFRTAGAIFDRGGCVAMYAEGGRSRTGELGDPRPGIGKLALQSGVPVVPVAIHGSKGVRGWRRGSFPKVTLMYGEPISFEQVSEPSKDQQLETAHRIFDPVKEMYRELDAEGRRSVRRRVRGGSVRSA